MIGAVCPLFHAISTDKLNLHHDQKRETDGHEGLPAGVTPSWSREYKKGTDHASSATRQKTRPIFPSQLFPASEWLISWAIEGQVCQKDRQAKHRHG